MFRAKQSDTKIKAATQSYKHARIQQFWTDRRLCVPKGPPSNNPCGEIRTCGEPRASGHTVAETPYQTTTSNPVNLN